MRYTKIFSKKNISKFKKFYQIPSITRINRRKYVRKTLLTLSRDNLKVLDIGSGYSNWSGLFKNCARYDTLDLNEDVSADYVGDFFSMEIPHSFDLIIGTELLEHLQTPALFFQRTYELLNDQGRVLISFPFLFKIHGDPDDYFRYTLQGIKALSKDLFEVEIAYNHGNKFQLIWEIITDGRLMIPFKLFNFLFSKIDHKNKYFPLGYVVLLKKVNSR
jgi:SAM-dependent methyltransferase